MKKQDTHRCGDCGFESARWFGKCPACGSWSSAEEASSPASVVARSLGALGEPEARIATGSPEVDRTLGGGLMQGSVTLLAGEPGIGKSTLLLQMLAGFAGAGQRCVLVSAEESLRQVVHRVRRLGIPPEDIHAVATASLPEAISAGVKAEVDLLIVDSIQAIHAPTLEQGAGSPNQVRECAASLVHHAKSTATSVLLVGHVTKDGSVAGPKTLEHMVDTVLSLEGDRSGSLRLLRAMKNRFGSCEETGVFSMTRRGLVAVEDPSAMLLEDRVDGINGSLVFPTLQGSRAILIEIQALVNDPGTSPPRRVALGLEQKRLALLLGVLDSRADLKLATADVFVAAPGGVAVKEPAADLAICLALHSAKGNRPVADGTVALGEVGLGGEIRRVPDLQRRLQEAARFGFKRALVPPRSQVTDSGLEVIEVKDLNAAFRAVEKLARARAA